MSVTTSVPDGTPPAPEPRGSGLLLTVLTVLACAAQAFVLFFTFVMGLGWGGLTYLAAVLQAALAFGLIAWFAARRRRAVVLVPLLSAALTAALAVASQAHGRATACSDEERAAVGQLAAPPGVEVAFKGEYVEGCMARTRMSLSSKTILEHYEAEFSRLGWRLTPGRNEATVGTAAEKDGISMVVDINTAGEGGAETLEVVVDDASATPCAMNTVDGFLKRTPTTAVEPGTWAMLVSTEDDPASVVIRDATSAVVFEQQARRRPGTADDELRMEDFPDSVDTLPLEEGDYQVECRPKDAAVATVPLRVTWDSPTEVEQEKDVVVRVFETPNDWE